MAGLRAWLERHRLGDTLGVLEDNDIDLELLAELTEEDLREMAFSIGQRRRFFRALESDPVMVAPPTASTDAQEDEPEIAEKRQLTVMFCDLVGSTELASALDPEAMSTLLQTYSAEVSRAIVAHGGHVAKFLGDGVLAYFGWPRADEDATSHAVRAGLQAVARVAAIEGPAGPLTARVGVATGPVVVSELRGVGVTERGSIAGATPNLAARIEAAAAPGEVLIHDATRRLIGALFDVEDAGKMVLKGFAEPVRTWRVLAPAKDAMRFEARSIAGLTAFVGREGEANLLATRWDRARSGDGQAVLLSGEAGIGKSRILRELRRTVRRAGEVAVVQIQCAPDEVDTAFSPFARELRSAAGFAAEDPIDAQVEKFDRHMEEIFPEPTEAGALLSAILGLPPDRYPVLKMAPQRRQLATIASFAERIRRLADRSPVLVLVEDIHWADPSSLVTLDTLVSNLEGAPILLTVTTRPGPPPSWISNANAAFYSLNRLSREAVQTIAQSVAGDKALPEEVLEQIRARTDGVPLFVEELTKAILEANLLDELEHEFVLTAPLPPLAIPSTLQDSLMARIDRMAPVKQILQAAAAIGREFIPELLAEVVDRQGSALHEALEQLVAAELVFRRSDAGGEKFVFKHALVQDTAYGSLLSGQRQLLHRRIAGALERRGAVDPAVLARHHLEAGDARRAAELYVEAGRTSQAQSALDEAIGAFEKGLVAVEHVAEGKAHDRLELDLRVGLGTTRMARFGWPHPSVAEALEPAFTLAEALADHDALCPLLWGLWVHFQTRTDFSRAWQWLERLEDVSSKAPESDLAIVNDMSVGCQHFWEASYDKALFHTDRLAAHYRRDRHSRITLHTNHDPLVFAQHWAGSLADWVSGRADRSVERMEEAIDLAREIGHPFNLVFALTAGATALYYLGRGDALLACNDEAAIIAEREALGPFSQHVNIYQWRGAALLVLGEAQEAYQFLKEGNDFWSASGGRICTAMFRSWQVEALAGLGRCEDAATLNEANITHCRTTGDRYMEPECLRLRGDLLASRGAKTSAVEAAYVEAIRTADATGARSWGLRATTSLAGVLYERGQRVHARAILGPAIDAIDSASESRDLIIAKGLLSKLG